MNIENLHNDSFNYPLELQPLFDAMKEGKTIKSIVCMGGSMNKDNPAKDFTIENFKAINYWVSIGSNNGYERFDYVDTDAPETDPNKSRTHKSFYMNWVRSFQLN